MMPGDPNSQPGHGDDELRGLFSILRREDEAHVPPFVAERKARRETLPARPGWRLAGVSVFAAAILAAVFLLRHEPGHSPEVPGRGSGPVVSITAWRPPTDFLLNTPGREILRSAPVITSQPYGHSSVSPLNRKRKPPSAPESPRSPTPLSQ
jgi:hypothetical protein